MNRFQIMVFILILVLTFCLGGLFGHFWGTKSTQPEPAIIRQVILMTDSRRYGEYETTIEFIEPKLTKQIDGNWGGRGDTIYVKR